MQSSRRAPTRLIVIGNPRSRRVANLEDAARRVGGIEIEVHSYLDFLRGRTDFGRGVFGKGGVDFDECGVGVGGGGGDVGRSVVRLESPGECTETFRAILAAGIEPMESQGRTPLSASEIERIPLDRGEIVGPLQWYLGLRRILSELESRCSGEHIQWMSTPRSIVTAFDKLACLELWSAAGLPVPQRLAGVRTYDEIRASVPQRHARLFVKLRYGYSAMGAVAIEWRDSLVRAITTVEVVRSETGDGSAGTRMQGGTRMFVTKKPRFLHDESEIAWLIDALGREEILVEEWMSKARLHGKSFDVRVVCIEAEPCHAVGRASTSPFTNLNLDADRIPRDELVEELGDAWPDLESLSSRAAAALPEAGMLGIDVLVRPDKKRFALLEANAFGDYLPGLTHDGMTTYEAELRALRGRLLKANERVPA